MPSTASARKAKKEPTTASVEATKEIKNNRIIMARIKQSHREADSGHTVSLRDLSK